MDTGFRAHPHRTSVALFLLMTERVASFEAGTSLAIAHHYKLAAHSSQSLLQRLGIRKIARRMFVEQGDEFMSAGRSSGLSLAQDLLGAQFAPVKLFIGAVVGAQS